MPWRPLTRWRARQRVSFCEGRPRRPQRRQRPGQRFSLVRLPLSSPTTTCAKSMTQHHSTPCACGRAEGCRFDRPLCTRALPLGVSFRWDISWPDCRLQLGPLPCCSCQVAQGPTDPTTGERHCCSCCQPYDGVPPRCVTYISENVSRWAYP